MTAPSAPGNPVTRGYPPAPRLDLREDLSGHPVADPYRWLEDPASEQTRRWLAARSRSSASARLACPAGMRWPAGSSS